MSLSIVIPILNASRTLPGALAALSGVDGEVLVVDGGSTDASAKMARDWGARVIVAPRGRGPQLRAGAEQARGDWLLFLHADTLLEEGWRKAVTHFCKDPANRTKAATFRFALDDPSRQARRLERMVAWRVRRLGLPYGDQGLLIHRDLYRAVGGYKPLELMEDVDFARRIGRRRVVALPVTARTSAARWRREGWLRRSARNLLCLLLYFARVPPRLIKRVYG
ncbi:TIGR04283 family arsenosugar biosynthesis glycosyltransferase [Methylocystis suflitae]|uniref:TIGR04283 family arsenosugar biosynthesis glycosyltransferase n=1 Tax=Methylocystis suflitae TaxID=2951405 RepID=UPI00210B43C9|nr:TIGR04283 family arsenosugar biosynthesis glycosyltransferase [Methylocystis suflitae]MCQ4188794.1 TIGR04283 family arsenosugar biosynthesis glycosyltransferase [Methylocystis suflitae]